MRIDLSPGNRPEDLIDAIWAVRRGNHRDLRPEVVRLLSHYDPFVRQEALSLLFAKWKDVSLRDRLIHILQNDPDAGVRSRAASALPCVSTPGTRREDKQLLREILLNPAEDDLVRRACYESLYMITHGRPKLLEDTEDLSVLIQQEWIHTDD